MDIRLQVNTSHLQIGFVLMDCVGCHAQQVSATSVLVTFTMFSKTLSRQEQDQSIPHSRLPEQPPFEAQHLHVPVAACS